MMDRREFSLNPDNSSSCRSHRIAEMAGGTTAECAAVVCCFPCTVFHVILMAVYKVPAGLYRKAVRKKRHQRLLKKGLKIQNDDITGTGHRSSIDGAGERFVMKSMESDEEFIKLENEMWEKFYGTGFFRSLSQRVN
ncbi:hypothetical protein R6Q57_026869 [Mikania cordata]